MITTEPVTRARLNALIENLRAAEMRANNAQSNALARGGISDWNVTHKTRADRDKAMDALDEALDALFKERENLYEIRADARRAGAVIANVQEALVGLTVHRVCEHDGLVREKK